jgi:hypothetical protein
MRLAVQVSVAAGVVLALSGGLTLALTARHGRPWVC